MDTPYTKSEKILKCSDLKLEPEMENFKLKAT